MPVPAAAVGVGDLHGRTVEWEIVFPGTLLIGDQLYSHLIFLDRAGVDHPDHVTARFFLFTLHPDYVAHFQFAVDAGDQGALGADVLSARRLRKGASVGTHPPDTDREIHTEARFGLMVSHVECPVPAMIPPWDAPRHYKVGGWSNQRSTTLGTCKSRSARFFCGLLGELLCELFHEFSIADDPDLLFFEKLA